MDTNERLIRAVQLAAHKLASSGKIEALLDDVLAISVEAVGASGGTVYIHDERTKTLSFRHVLPEDVRVKLPVQAIPDDFGVAGRVFQSRKTEISEMPERSDIPPTAIESATGVMIRNMITAPLMMQDEDPIGVVQLVNKLDGRFTDTDAAVLDTVASVATMAVLNSRLTDEATRASSLLGMGKVSHDIGNLAASLYANISFSELAIDGLREHVSASGKNETAEMYADSLQGMLAELKASVDRIVGYSRLVSDLSAGRELRPNMVAAPMGHTIETAAAFLASEGRKHAVAIRYEIADSAPATMHDELYLFRIVQNLVGNAIKAIRETIPEEWQARLGEDDEAVFGEVAVRYRYGDGLHVVEVQDSGPGMSKEVVDRILAGNAQSQWVKGGGSGWGMKIALELAATHNARVEVDSAPGKGATFRVSFPHVGAPSVAERSVGTKSNA